MAKPVQLHSNVQNTRYSQYGHIRPPNIGAMPGLIHVRRPELYKPSMNSRRPRKNRTLLLATSAEAPDLFAQNRKPPSNKTHANMTALPMRYSL